MRVKFYTILYLAYDKLSTELLPRRTISRKNLSTLYNRFCKKNRLTNAIDIFLQHKFGKTHESRIKRLLEDITIELNDLNRIIVNSWEQTKYIIHLNGYCLQKTK